MKLLFCRECKDVFNLSSIIKTCTCGKTSGKYLKDGMNAEYAGPCVPLGFSNPSFVEAIKNQPEKDWGKNFTAFVIQKQCVTMKKTDVPVLIEKEGWICKGCNCEVYSGNVIGHDDDNKICLFCMTHN